MHLLNLISVGVGVYRDVRGGCIKCSVNDKHRKCISAQSITSSHIGVGKERGQVPSSKFEWQLLMRAHLLNSEDKLVLVEWVHWVELETVTKYIQLPLIQ